MDDSLCLPGIHVIGGKVYVAGIFDGKSHSTGDRRSSSGYFELDALYRSDSIIEVDDRVLFLLPPINESVTVPIKTLRLARAYSKYAEVLEDDRYYIPYCSIDVYKHKLLVLLPDINSYIRVDLLDEFVSSDCDTFTRDDIERVCKSIKCKQTTKRDKAEMDMALHVVRTHEIAFI